MSYRAVFVFLLSSLLFSASSIAQKPFTEGTISYNIKLISADHKEYNGEYTFTFKGPHIKKELKLDNGFNDIVIMDCALNSVYSLQNRSGKKYAIQLSMDDVLKKQIPFSTYTLNTEENSNKSIAGYKVYKCKVNYKNGSTTDVYYSNEWYPAQPVTFERFPGAKFLPMQYSYTDENGTTMEFEVSTIELSPVENAVFRIPTDYKMISYEDYKQLTR